MADPDLDRLTRFVDPVAGDVLDVGCGAGALVRALQRHGARAVGIEISADQLAHARDADDGHGARYLVGRAEALPFADASLDLVVYDRSLHHVPIPRMGTALDEAARVLRPGGRVYVAEPVAAGDLYALVKLVDDEDAVRAAARDALAAADARGLRTIATADDELAVRLADVDALRTRIVAVDPVRAAAFDARRAELERAFRTLGEPDGAGRRFGQTIHVVVLAPS